MFFAIKKEFKSRPLHLILKKRKKKVFRKNAENIDDIITEIDTVTTLLPARKDLSIYRRDLLNVFENNYLILSKNNN